MVLECVSVVGAMRSNLMRYSITEKHRIIGADYEKSGLSQGNRLASRNTSPSLQIEPVPYSGQQLTSTREGVFSQEIGTRYNSGPISILSLADKIIIKSKPRSATTHLPSSRGPFVGDVYAAKSCSDGSWEKKTVQGAT